MRNARMLAVVGALLAPTLSLAQGAEEFYAGKDVTLVVSAAPAGGADIYARAFAPFLSKHLPGQPNVIVTNVPGASGLTAATQLQRSTDADGLTMALLQSNNLYIPLLEEGAVPFDPREVDWLGSIASERHVLVTWKTSGLETFDDVLASEEPVIIGATTLNQINGTLPALLQQSLPDAPIEVITGYEGTGEILLAMQRGEVMARSQSVTSLFAGSERQYLESGDLIPLLLLNNTPSPALPDLPLITDVVSGEQVEATFDFVLLPLRASRPFAVPKGVPEDRLEALRAGLEAAARDPGFAEALSQMASDTEFLSGEEVAGIVEQIYETPDEVLASFRELLQ